MGRPALKCNAAQLVLKYLLSYKAELCNTWRSRIYYYSSATTFADVCVDLKDFIEEQPKGEKIVTKLKDVDMCREYVGDALVEFVKAKPAFFKDAMLSKKHFWLVPAWKRAMTFVFMLKYVTGQAGILQVFSRAYKGLIWSHLISVLTRL